MTKFTRLLSDLSTDDLPLVGSSNLAKSQTIQLLNKLHIPMPGGWIITTEAFRHFINSTDLHEIISHNLAGLKVKNRPDLKERSTVIGRAIASTPFPDGFDKAITKAYHDSQTRFGKNCPFIVSLSILNSKNSTEQIVPLGQGLHSLDQLKNLIHQAYASQFSEQAFLDRAEQKVDLKFISVAINLYQLVQSGESVSGTITTVELGSGHPSFISISSSFGLLPDTSEDSFPNDEYLVFKPKLDKFRPLISSHLAHKTHKIIFNSDKSQPTQKVEIASNKQEASSLTDPEIFQLSKWAVQIEKNYAASNPPAPLQITWAKDAPTHKFYILDILPLFNSPPFTLANTLSPTQTQVTQNITDPSQALSDSFLASSGGFYDPTQVIINQIGIHPLALINYSKQSDLLKAEIDQKITGSKTQFYQQTLSSNLAKVASAFYPQPVIVSLSDLTGNQYHSLIGGQSFDHPETNPLLGHHGASKYLDRKFKPLFELEVQAIKKVYEELGLDNIHLAIPFCHTPEQGKAVIELINKSGLNHRHHKNIQIYLIAQTPANFILAEDFLKVFDGLIIDTDTLHPLTTGTSTINDQPNLAVQALIAQATKITLKSHKFLSAIQKTPSSGLTKFLYQQDFPSISVNYSDLATTTKLVQKLEADA